MVGAYILTRRGTCIEALTGSLFLHLCSAPAVSEQPEAFHSGSKCAQLQRAAQVRLGLCHVLLQGSLSTKDVAHRLHLSAADLSDSFSLKGKSEK